MQRKLAAFEPDGEPQVALCFNNDVVIGVRVTGELTDADRDLTFLAYNFTRWQFLEARTQAESAESSEQLDSVFEQLYRAMRLENVLVYSSFEMVNRHLLHQAQYHQHQEDYVADNLAVAEKALRRSVQRFDIVKFEGVKFAFDKFAAVWISRELLPASNPETNPPAEQPMSVVDPDQDWAAVVSVDAGSFYLRYEGVSATSTKNEERVSVVEQAQWLRELSGQVAAPHVIGSSARSSVPVLWECDWVRRWANVAGDDSAW